MPSDGWLVVGERDGGVDVAEGLTVSVLVAVGVMDPDFDQDRDQGTLMVGLGVSYV